MRFKNIVKSNKWMSVAGYVTLLTRQVISEEFSQCYPDVNICLWTNGSLLTRSNAEAACQQRNNSFLPRITDSRVQDKLSVFRVHAHNALGGSGFWIDVHAVAVSEFHWIDGSPLTGSFLLSLVKICRVVPSKTLLYASVCTVVSIFHFNQSVTLWKCTKPAEYIGLIKQPVAYSGLYALRFSHTKDLDEIPYNGGTARRVMSVDIL